MGVRRVWVESPSPAEVTAAWSDCDAIARARELDCVETARMRTQRQEAKGSRPRLFLSPDHVKPYFPADVSLAARNILKDRLDACACPRPRSKVQYGGRRNRRFCTSGSNVRVLDIAVTYYR